MTFDWDETGRFSLRSSAFISGSFLAVFRPCFVERGTIRSAYLPAVIAETDSRERSIHSEGKTPSSATPAMAMAMAA